MHIYTAKGEKGVRSAVAYIAGVSGHLVLKIFTKKIDDICLFYSLFILKKLQNKL